MFPLISVTEIEYHAINYRNGQKMTTYLWKPHFYTYSREDSWL